MVEPINNLDNPRDCPDCGLSARGGVHHCPKPPAPFHKLTVTDLSQLIFQLMEFQKAGTYIAGWESDGKLPAITFHYLDKSEMQNDNQ